MHGLNISDLAYDSIAEIFQKDENGNYIQLCSYFSGLLLTSATDEEILAHLRRLVFSKVNHSIFRLYTEIDPSLAKILRNLKIAINTLRNFSEVERFGEPCIAPCMYDTLGHLPPISFEKLERDFIPYVKDYDNVPELLAKFSLYLREQEDHSRIIPMVTVGLLFRAVFVHTHETPTKAVEIDDVLLVDDSIKIIREACEQVQKKNKNKYVDRRKIDNEIYQNYFKVLEEALYEKFIGNDGHDFSLFESLKQYAPYLTKADYMKNHRNKLEYLLKKTNKEVIKRLKD